ncbi:hypothetical protein F5Y12DRAFT_779784 [Xylaria sp. FL1777]|nr:hypothetical protein F5Y12DRAFT_779784 [Xylaria sp. FL1777]
MEVDNTWIINALQGILPDHTLQLLHDHVLHPSSTMRTVYSYVVLGMQRTALTLQPLISPVAERAIRALQDSPDFVFFGLLLTLFFMMFQILLWVQRTISFFTRLAFRAVLWIFIGLAIMAVWNRGPEAFIADLVVVARRLVVYAAMVKDIWISEYQKYDAQTRAGAGTGAFSGGRGSMGSGRSAGYSGRSSGR